MFELSTANLDEMAPYIKGEQFIEGTGNFEEINKEYFQVFIDKLEQYEVMKIVFDRMEHYADFYKYCPDFDYWVPKQQKDIFYAAKCGCIIEGVPMYLAYLVKKALEEYPSPNMVPLRLNTQTLSTCFKKGTFAKGISLYTLICNMSKQNYTVIDKTHLVSRLRDFTEVYIPNTNMIALVPHNLGSALTDDFIRSLDMTSSGLMSVKDGIYLNRIAGYKGVCNSYYDLRELC